MGGLGATRIQLCGRYVVVIDGSRVEDKLPAAEEESCSPISCSTAAGR